MQRNQPPAVPFGLPGQVQNSFVFILNKPVIDGDKPGNRYEQYKEYRDEYLGHDHSLFFPVSSIYSLNSAGS